MDRDSGVADEVGDGDGEEEEEDDDVAGEILMGEKMDADDDDCWPATKPWFPMLALTISP